MEYRHVIPVRDILEKRILRDPSFGFPRCAIMASAGTGKTYQLAMRYIRLLLHGAEPDEIAAVTFSKKAAGEIFDKIVSILLEIIENKEAREKAERQGFIPPGTAPEQLSAVLRKLLSARRRLHIETNDSFLMQILQGAPAEFGIRGEIRIADENDDAPRQRALLEKLHSPEYAGPGESADANRRTLYQILKDCSYGREKPSLCGAVTELLKDRFPDYLTMPYRSCWTMPGIDGILCKRLGRNDLEKMDRAYHEALTSNAEEAKFPAALCAKFENLWQDAVAVPAESPRRPESKTASFFLEYKIIDCGPHCHVKYRKFYEVSSELTDMVRTLVLHLLAAECKAVSDRTEAVFRLMQTFEASYSAQTREAGLLTFSDVLHIINHKKNQNSGGMQVLLERLGTRIGHYLLDEFQDTSTLQWNVLDELAGEILASDDPPRFSSFFMVGDIKQSIYQWRNANPSLFKDICRIYGFFPPPGTKTETGAPLPAVSLPEDMTATAVFESGKNDDGLFHGLLQSLTRSFRSSTPVLQAVNDVFSPDRKLVFPDRFEKNSGMFELQRGKMDFREHCSGLDRNPETGFAILFETPRNDQKNFPSVLAALLRKLKPFDRPKPLSVAVLFRWNKNILECFEAMRRDAPDIPVSMDGKITLAQSMIWTVFRQILRLAAHPGDPLAGPYLNMLRTTSSGSVASDLKKLLYPSCSEPLPSLLRREFENTGCLSLFRRFLRAFSIENAEPDAVRMIERSLIQLYQNEQPSIDKAIEFLDRASGRLSSALKTVQLMTIHQSKGLGFDVVILADEALSPDAPIIFSADEQTRSCFFTPKSDWQSALTEVQKILVRQREKECYEKFCNLYVAMTRAKRGLYMFIEGEGGAAGTLTQADILRAALASVNREIPRKTQAFADELSLNVLYSQGDPDWMEEPESQKEFKVLSSSEEEVLRERQFRLSLPSDPFSKPVRTCAAASTHEVPSFHSGYMTAPLRFAARPAADFGTEIHRIMSAAEWLENPSDVQSLLARTAPGDEAAGFVKQALDHPQIFECFRHPDVSHAEVWREKSFLIPRDGDFVSGIMDRAVIEYDPDGLPLRATVTDFKTDRLTAPEEFLERYRPQLEEYRLALSHLTGLSVQDISCVIAALRPGLAIRF